MRSRILGALLVGVGLIFGAYTFSDSSTSSLLASSDPTLGVVTGQAPNRSYINTHDSDNDGMPDWQEALRTTEPLRIDPATSIFKIPDTITDKFAIEFFESFMRAQGYGVFGETNEELVTKSVQELEVATREELYRVDDLSGIIETTDSNLLNYAAEVLRIASTGEVSTTLNEAEITLAAVRNQDPAQLETLDENIAAFNGYIEQMLATPVPQGFTQEHLNLINTYQAVLFDIKAMRTAFEDPLNALVRLQRYQEDVRGVITALSDLFFALEAADVPVDSLLN